MKTVPSCSRRSVIRSLVGGSLLLPAILSELLAANEVHIHDFHATILHLLGLDHQRLTLRRAGRDFRLTDVHGRVVHEIPA